MQAHGIGRLPDLSLYADAQPHLTRLRTIVSSLPSKRFIVGSVGVLLLAGSLGAWVYLIGFRLYAMSHF